MKVKGNTIEYKGHYIDIDIASPDHFNAFYFDVTTLNHRLLKSYETLELAIEWIDEQESSLSK